MINSIAPVKAQSASQNELDYIEEILALAQDPQLELKEDQKKRCFEEIVEKNLIKSVFQPIVDLRSGRVLGHEVLSRGISPLEYPDLLFNQARRHNRLWDLEKSCRQRAIESITKAPEYAQDKLFFINVSPFVFRDPRFKSGFTLDTLHKYGIDQRQIVIEITEEEVWRDYDELEELVRHYTAQGFRIALDDFGSGHSSLVTLVATSPNFIKLDKELIRDIHRHSYKQSLVRSVVSFANSVDGQLIAEGIENWAELDVIIRLGVRYAQGYLFAHPEADIKPLPKPVQYRLANTINRYNYPKIDVDESVIRLATRRHTALKGTLNGETTDKFFKQHPKDDHIVIIDDDEKPTGLITRQHFYNQTGGPFGYSLMKRKSLENTAKREFLSVKSMMPMTTLSKLAIGRKTEDIYDPVIITDEKGKLIGTVTIKQLIDRASELELNAALGANPLTKLPGNRMIQKWVASALDSENFTIIYADLDRFKEYNDSYGFIMGDEMLLKTAEIMRNEVNNSKYNAKLGHIGGDDFIIVCEREIMAEFTHSLCTRFDKEKMPLFKPAHIDSGCFPSTSRQGKKVCTPLTTLSLAVITQEAVPPPRHPAMLSKLSASLKKKIKEQSYITGQSGFMFERRKIKSEVAL